MSGIFVNYRSDDDDFAAALVDDHLRAVFGDRNVFKDTRSLEAGTDFPPELWRRLLSSRVLLVLIGRRWLTPDAGGLRRIDRADDYVRQEIEAALQAGLRIIPVLLNNAPLPAADELPASLRGLVTRQFVRLRQRHSGMDLSHLVEALSSSVPPLRAPATGGVPPQVPGHVEFHEGGVWAQGATINGDVVSRDKYVQGGTS
ncbi:TIR domain-containing protein [Actinoplanes sp. NPDC049681]|uniref:TIR domain-containing protein n=1 Tax=Actinoplanes sp. NPDC049681 TaxID=3363905 RepID=UPI003793DE3A